MELRKFHEAGRTGLRAMPLRHQAWTITPGGYVFAAQRRQDICSIPHFPGRTYCPVPKVS